MRKGEFQLIKHYYFNNTKIANAITTIDNFSQNLAVLEFGKDRPDVCCYINFESEDLRDSLSITRFDVMVMDAIYTLFVSGKDIVSLEMIANTIACKEVSLDKSSSTKLRAIRKAIFKLQGIVVSIDYTEIERAKGTILDEANESCLREEALLPMTTEIRKSKVKHRNKTVYKIYKTPILYDYAEKLSRIIKVPTSVLSIDGIREDDDFLAIKQQLVKEIMIMKNTKNKYVNRMIKYEWANGERGGFAERVGLKKENYSNEIQWNKRKVKLTNQLKVILEHLVSVKFIKGYLPIKDGKSVVGFEIKL